MEKMSAGRFHNVAPGIVAQCARGRLQYVNVKLERSPTALVLPVAKIGISARPRWQLSINATRNCCGAGGGLWPEAAFVVRTDLVANGGKADAAGSRANDAIDP